MHLFKTGDDDTRTAFSFNSDLSGRVRITASNGRAIEIPGEHLLQFFAHYIRSERISALEQADDRAVLGLT
jgi:hypothetical protein